MLWQTMHNRKLQHSLLSPDEFMSQHKATQLEAA
jgi:hypothetical protein